MIEGSAMLNVAPYFRLAIESLDESARIPDVRLAPLVVLASQQDFINHLVYAANHYLPLSLDEHFLQNSSIGSPYQKWAKFTGDEFRMLDCSFWMLMQATSRLWHEVHMRYPEGPDINLGEFYRRTKTTSNVFTGLICEKKHRDAYLGISITDESALVCHALDWSSPEPRIARSEMSTDRRSRVALKNSLMSEAGELTDLHRLYTERCKKYSEENDIYEKHDRIHESYWTVISEHRK